MPSPSSFVASALLALASFSACPSLASPAQEGVAIARIPVHVVQGRLVAACQISAQKRIAANLFIDYDAPFGLLLHNKAAAGIESEADDGTPRPITVHLPDLNVVVAQREHGDEAYFERFTKWYSKELGENAVVGTLGARVLSQYHVAFDLGSGFMELSAPHPKNEQKPAEQDGAVLVPLTLFNDLVWFPVAYGTGRAGAIAMATSKYETRADVDLCDELGARAGDIGAVRVGALEVSRFVPMRPEPMRHVHPDGVFGQIGLDLLQHFRVEIDRVNRWSLWTETAPPAFPTAEVDFYRARASDQAEPVEAWLVAHPKERLAPEAAQLLLERRLERQSDETALRKALEFVQATRPDDLKATGALELMQTMLQAGQPKYALAAAELGIAKGREDRYPDAVHHLHAQMGSILLEQDERREAWKHLLSAAFGLPDDGPLNLDLARCYELDQRYPRAYSRYLQALLSPDSGQAAMEGLERIQPQLEEAEAFSADAIEKLIEGKVEGFGVATKFHPDESDPTTRVVLDEYFTCADYEFEIGVVLARDGLRDHFGRDYLVQVTYDLPDPSLEPLVNPLSMAMARAYTGGRIAHLCDGVYELPAGARSRFKQEVYEACRGAVMQRLAERTDHEIALEARADRTGIRGTASFRGPDEDLIAQLILVERGVIFPGKSKVVIHRNVARAALTSDLEGQSYAPFREEMTIEFDRTWADIARETSEFLDRCAQDGTGIVSRFATRIDPRQASVVAILRSRETGAVVQAAQIDPVLPEELK